MTKTTAKKSAAKKPAAKLDNTYMMWVGSEHYPTIGDWVKEAEELGVSKRLPNEHVARALMADGTAVFIAHDEGKHAECTECSGVVACGECRKRTVEADKLRARATEMRKGEGPEAAKLLTKADLVETQAVELEDQNGACEVCLGAGSIEGGTGGKVVFEDGEAWDYRQYNYWLHQPKVWTPEAKGGLSEIARCECCGGTGRLPLGVVFGLFLPQAIEVIVGGEGSPEAEAAKAAGFAPVTTATVATERKRGCGKRKPGGVYVVTKAEGDAKAKDAVDALRKAGIDREVEVKGNFIRFIEPIEIHGAKRFRGLGRVELAALAEGAALADAAEMAVDATV
jgi:hypothetical protein